MKMIIIFIFFWLISLQIVKAQNYPYDIAKDTISYINIQQFFRNSFVNNRLSSDSLCILEFCSLTLFIDSSGIIYKSSQSPNIPIYISDFLKLTISNLNKLKIEQKYFLNTFLKKNLIYKPIVVPMIFNLFSGACTANFTMKSYKSILSLFANSDKMPNKLTGEYDDVAIEGVLLNTILFQSKFSYRRY
jgi:hypothetical protein